MLDRLGDWPEEQTNQLSASQHKWSFILYFRTARTLAIQSRNRWAQSQHILIIFNVLKYNAHTVILVLLCSWQERFTVYRAMFFSQVSWRCVFFKAGMYENWRSKTVFLLTEEVTNNKVHVHWCCLNGVLKMNPVDSAAIPRPPSAKARQNGTTEGIHDYFIVFTGFHLQLQVLKDWIKSCCKPVCFMGKCSL